MYQKYNKNLIKKEIGTKEEIMKSKSKDFDEWTHRPSKYTHRT